MNTIAMIVLVTILSDFILNIIADILNLHMLHDELPREFQDAYDPEQYRKSQLYLKVNTRFEWITSSFSLILILAFWFLKGFPYLDQWIRSFNLNPIVSGLLFMGALVLLKTFLSIPFSIYTTFVIEERFGFNQTTWKTFVTDLLKGLALSILLGAPLLAGVLAFFQFAGSNAWWFCWIVVTLYMLGVQFIAPTWIMPLFNKFSPLDPGELKSAILAYAESIKFPLENVYVLDGSKRSSKSNAFFTGFGKHKRIVLFDTLIKRHTVHELVAVLAHEMGHYKKKHIQFNILFGILQMGLVLFLLSLFISYQGLFDAFYMDNKSVYAGFIFFAMLFSPLNFFIGLFMQALSRRNEVQADTFAVTTTEDATSMVDALKKLSVHNLSNLRPHPFYVFLNYSHPPVLQRIKAILSHQS